MAEPITRMNYFDHQFLRAEDFTLEQQYQNRMRQLHNSSLHTWGIVRGLDVTYESGASVVKVAKGIAVDSDGQELVLVDDAQTADLSGFKVNTVYVTLTFAKQAVDTTNETGVTGNRHWTEVPQLAVNTQKPDDVSKSLVLSKVTIDASGKVTGTVDGSDRRYAGVAGGDLQVRSLTLTSQAVASTAWPSLTCSAANTVTLAGNLSVTGALGMPNTEILLRGIGDANHGLGYYGTNKLFMNTNINGPVLYGYTGGALGTTNGGQKIALVWDNNTNVNVRRALTVGDAANPALSVDSAKVTMLQTIPVSMGALTCTSISSSMWKVTSLVQAKAWPNATEASAPPLWTMDFASGGGTLLLVLSGTIFGASAKTVGVQVRIDAGGTIWPMTYYENLSNVRIPLMNHIVVTGVAAGTHQLSLTPATTDTRANSNDLFSITLMEFPF